MRNTSKRSAQNTEPTGFPKEWDMGRNFKELRAKMDPERRERVERLW